MSTDRDRRALLIVDYSNAFPGRVDETGAMATSVALQRIVVSVAEAAEASVVDVRLYGGWTTSTGLSNAASRALLTIAAANPFPFAREGSIVHGQFDLATRLLSVPEYEFPDTYRVRGAVPRLRLRDGALPENCIADPENCPAAILKRFTRGPRKLCPATDCTVTCQSAFIHAEQKMVDTLMASDLLHACRLELTRFGGHPILDACPGEGGPDGSSIEVSRGVPA